MLAPKFNQENKSKRFTILKGLVVRNFVFFFANIYFRGHKANISCKCTVIA